MNIQNMNIQVSERIDSDSEYICELPWLIVKTVQVLESEMVVIERKSQWCNCSAFIICSTKIHFAIYFRLHTGANEDDLKYLSYFFKPNFSLTWTLIDIIPL